MNTAREYRLYPTDEQKTLFMKTFGCCRLVWNLMLEDHEAMRRRGEKAKFPPPSIYKDERPFLREVDSLALANVWRHLLLAHQQSFEVEGKGRPKKKKKGKCRYSYTTSLTNGNIRLSATHIRLPKVGEVKAVIHRPPPEGYALKSATVSMEPDGTFYVSVLYGNEADAEEGERLEQNAIGLDYKSDGFYVDSNGKTLGSPKFFRRSQKSLTKAQRRLSKKKFLSNNWKKQKKKVGKVHRRIANRRKDFLHKASSDLATRYTLVCVENLNLKALANKKFGNGKATGDNAYGMFLRMLEYKLLARGGRLVKVDRWFPSSQLCSHCHTRNPKTKDLSVRKWTCASCGTEHDRDFNAAVNIRNEGVRLYLAS